MSKQSVHIRLDNSVYLALKSKEINITSTVNDLLRNFLETEDIKTDESVLLDELNKLQSKKKELDDLIKTVVVKLQIVKEKNLKEQKEHDIKMKQFIASMRHNNPARDM